MKSPVLALGLTFAIAFSGYAFAAPQPLTRAACTAAGMNWNDSANVCGGGSAGKAAKEEGKKGDKDKGGKDKNNKGSKKPTKKVIKKVQGNKVTKKVTTSEGTTKSTEKKGPSKKEQRKFFKWLKQQDNKKS